MIDRIVSWHGDVFRIFGAVSVIVVGINAQVRTDMQRWMAGERRMIHDSFPLALIGIGVIGI